MKVRINAILHIQDPGLGIVLSNELEDKCHDNLNVITKLPPIR